MLAALVLAAGLTACGSAATTTTTTAVNTPAPANAAPKTSAPPAAAAPASAKPASASASARVSAAAKPSAARVTLTAGPYTVAKDSVGVLHAYGYVENKGAVAATNVQVAMSLLDDMGKTLAAGTGLDLRGIIPPGEKSPYAVQFEQAPTKWASEKVQVQGQPFDPKSLLAALAPVMLQTEGVAPAAGQFGATIAGQIKNNTDKPVTLASVTGIIYDAAGKPLSVDQTFSQLDTIDPGQDAPFSLSFSDVKTISKFEVFAEGRPKS